MAILVSSCSLLRRGHRGQRAVPVVSLGFRFLFIVVYYKVPENDY